MIRGLVTVRTCTFMLCGLLFLILCGLWFIGCGGRPRTLEINALACVPEIKGSIRTDITLSSDGKSVITTLKEGIVFYSADANLRVEHKYQRLQLTGVPGTFQEVAAGSNIVAAGSYVFIFGRSKLLRFDPRNSGAIDQIDLQGDADKVFVSSDAGCLAVYRRAIGRLDIIDLDKRKIVRSFQGSLPTADVVLTVWAGFVQDNKLLVFYEQIDNHLTVWDVKREVKVNGITLNVQYYDNCFLANEGNSLAIYGANKRCYVYSVPDLVKVLEIETDRPIGCACLRDNVLYLGLRQQNLALLGDSGCVCMYDFTTGACIGRFRADERALDWIAVSGDGRYLFTRGDSGLKSWDLANILQQIKK
jgi:WD40 repeat protein